MTANFHRRAALLGFLAASFALSSVPGVNSFLGWFETYFHEVSHGIAAVITGGSAERLELRINGSGTMWTAGGFQPFISFAGYAGAAVWGCLLYVAASRSERRPKLLVGALGASVLWCLLFHVHKTDLVSVGVCAAIGSAAILLLTETGAILARPALRLIGAYVMVSATRAPTYILATGVGHNDASDLRSALLLPEAFWVCLWVGLSLAAIIVTWIIESRADRAETSTGQRVSAASPVR